MKKYDYYPKALQKMFCSIDRIYIEKELRSIAYAGSGSDREGNITGSVIGIRKSAIDEKLKTNHNFILERAIIIWRCRGFIYDHSRFTTNSYK
ncbi:MAG: hypothetical protein U0T83_02555 [Bacteriovoracaceae bacterium]